jgi:peptide/nickel transport system permease protein
MTARGSGLPSLLRLDSALLVGLCMFVAMALLVVAGNLVIGLDPQKTSPEVLSPPSALHWLGTDSVGRDVAARLVLGARSSLSVAILAMLATMVLGILFGISAGFLGGVADWTIMRVVDILLSVPPLLMAITILAAIGPSIPTLVIVLIVTYTPQVIRVVRAAALQVGNRPFVESARVSGLPAPVTMVKHILPNVRGTLIVQATITVAHMLLIETALSFLGMGVQPPAPSLGFMVSEGRQWMEIAPWTVLAPGSVIVFVVGAFTFLGHGLDSSLARRS